MPLTRRFRRGQIYPGMLLFGTAGLLVERFDPMMVFLIAAATKLAEAMIARFSVMRAL